MRFMGTGGYGSGNRIIWPHFFALALGFGNGIIFMMSYIIQRMSPCASYNLIKKELNEHACAAHIRSIVNWILN